MSTPRIVLVHSPFVGPASWLAVAATLRGMGWSVAPPARAAPSDVEPPYYSRLADRIASETAIDVGEPTVLVGHSGAGGLLPSIAEAVDAGVIAAIFVDAILPYPGRSWFETTSPGLAERLRSRIVDGVLPPWNQWFPSEVFDRLLPDPAVRDAFVADLGAVPAAFADEPAPACPHWPPRRCAYLQLSEGYAAEAETAAAMGWLARRDNIHHLATLTHPDRVAATLHSMIHALTDSA